MKRTILLFLLVTLLFSMLTLAACQIGSNDDPKDEQTEEPGQNGDPQDGESGDHPLYTEGDGALGGDGNVPAGGDGEVNPGTTTPADSFDD